jgi:hypothetical protein
MHPTLTTIPDERIITRIYTVRGKKVMLDRDLAELYGVTTGNLNKAVSRNVDRFPEDFMFQLTREELKHLIFQNGTSSWGGTRKLPRAFTEHGVVMLSSVLKSKRAIQVNIQVVRTFTKLRELLTTHADLRRKIEEMEQQYDRKFKVVFEAINRLLTEEEKPKQPIGFGRGQNHAQKTRSSRNESV